MNQIIDQSRRTQIHCKILHKGLFPLFVLKQIKKENVSKDQFCPLALMMEIVENYSHDLFPRCMSVQDAPQNARGVWNKTQRVDVFENYKSQKHDYSFSLKMFLHVSR